MRLLCYNKHVSFKVNKHKQKSDKNNFRRRKCMLMRKNTPGKAVRTTSVYSPTTGRKSKKQRHLDIDAPVGDFSPVFDPKEPTAK